MAALKKVEEFRFIDPYQYRMKECELAGWDVDKTDWGSSLH